MQLIALGLGKPEHAERYCGALAPSHTCFTDTTNDSYYAWGLRQRTFGETLANSVNIVRVSVRAAAAGHRQGAPTGDVQMMPGAFIVDTQGVIRYAYYGQYAGDDPDIAELVAVGQALHTKTDHPTGG